MAQWSPDICRAATFPHAGAYPELDSRTGRVAAVIVQSSGVFPMRLTRSLAALALLAAVSAPLAAQQQMMQERLDTGALARIRDEGLNRSHIDSLAGQLMDVIGPRLTGSPSLRHAQDWARATFTSWGFANAAIEPWDSLFGRGLEPVSYFARSTQPFVQPLYAMPL